MDIKNLKRDVATIEAGQWVDEIPGMGSLRLRVRGMASKMYTADLNRRSRAVPQEGRQRDNSLTPEAATRVMGESLHAQVLLEWDGLEDDGKPLEFDRDVALEWLTNPEYRLFLDAVVYAASVVDNGRAAVNKGLEKN